MSKARYKYWTRDNFTEHFSKQTADYPIDLYEMHEVVHDIRWNPNEFNGCNFVQDDLHPFWPCFRHDYDWIVNGGSKEADLRFRKNLIAFGFSKLRANIFYIGVRTGWLLWFKWQK